MNKVTEWPRMPRLVPLLALKILYPGKPLCPRQTRVAGDPTQETQYKKL